VWRDVLRTRVAAICVRLEIVVARSVVLEIRGIEALVWRI